MRYLWGLRGGGAVRNYTEGRDAVKITTLDSGGPFVYELYDDLMFMSWPEEEEVAVSVRIKVDISRAMASLQHLQDNIEKTARRIKETHDKAMRLTWPEVSA